MSLKNSKKTNVDIKPIEHIGKVLLQIIKFVFSFFFLLEAKFVELRSKSPSVEKDLSSSSSLSVWVCRPVLAICC